MDRQDWLRRLNYLGSAVGGAEQLVSLDPEEMLASAQATTGLTDFGDDDWREAYDQLTASIAKDVDLTTIGRLMSRGDILRALRNRLFVVNALKQTPAILNEQIVAPLLIAGQGRSGTTILFELLAQDPNNRAPLAWEASSPVAPSEKTLADGITRAEIAECDNELWDDVQPEMLAAHEHRWDLPGMHPFHGTRVFVRFLGGVVLGPWIPEVEIPNRLEFRIRLAQEDLAAPTTR